METTQTHKEFTADAPLLDNDPEGIWTKSLSELKNSLDPQIFNAWIKPLTIIKCVNNETEGQIQEIELGAPNKFCCEHVKRHYSNEISSTLSTVVGAANVVVKFKTASKGSAATSFKTKPVNTVKKEVKSEVETAQTAADLVKQAASRPQKRVNASGVAHENTNLNPKYNFSNYVVGGCNQFANAVARRVSEALGSAYNPLFLYGGVGLGKTHLANAIGNAAWRRGKNALLVTSESFVNELISAIRSDNMPQFKNKFRSLDLLIIDDIQFIIGKERTQEEFFHTFNYLYNQQKQIIVTSDRLPQELVGLEERLRTRFSCGISADLQTPDFETRVAILVRKAESTDMELPDEVARFLAEKIDTNIRELEGALNRLQAASSLYNKPITLELAESSLSALLLERRQDVTPERIQKISAEYFNVSVSDIIGKRRTSNIAFARHVAMKLCRTLTGCSYPEIGALFGGRDHSTVIHANRTIDKKISQDPEIKHQVETVEKLIKEK